ncbi:MAG: hypothetical protein WBC71_04975, partial [Salaquimonas sp.]
LTLNEVQADKDQLRAEFAMSTRRLELSIEELQEKASRQVIEINRKRDELTKLAAESREKIQTVAELDARSSELRSRLAEREEMLAKVSGELNTTREKLENRALELERLQGILSETRSEADSKRIELVAKQTSLDDLNDRAADFEAEKKQLKDEMEELRRNLKKSEAEFASAEQRSKDADSRLTRLQKNNADLEEKLQRRERDIAELRSSDGAESDSSSELTRLLMEERQKVNTLEANLAKTTLRMEAMLSDASNENVSRAVKTLNSEKNDLRKKLKAAVQARDALEKEVRSYRDNTGVEWENERKDNAILRERINDLAAQVTAMTAAIEGPESPINDILEEAVKAKGSKKSSAGHGNSLADRVRALQESARVKRA